MFSGLKVRCPAWRAPRPKPMSGYDNLPNADTPVRYATSLVDVIPVLSVVVQSEDRASRRSDQALAERCATAFES